MSGQASCQTTYSGAGSHTIEATYSGSVDFAGSSSAPLDQIVNPVPLSLVGSASARNGQVKMKEACAATAAGGCVVTNRLTTVETTKGDHIVGLSASRAKRKRHTLTVGSKTVTIRPGQTRTVAVPLNATGRKLLKRFGKLPVTLTVSLREDDHEITVANRKPTVKPAKKKRHHRK